MQESEIIDRLRKNVWTNPHLSLSFLDDCARIPEGRGELVVTVDALVEDVHFRRKLISGFDLAWKTLAVNLSDLNSKGAEPIGFLLTLNLPRDVEVSWFDNFVAGLDACARHYQCPLLGGDTTGSKSGLGLQVTALGRSLRPCWRTGGQPGDVIAITGGVGGSGMGLAIQEGEFVDRRLNHEEKQKCLFAHHRPRPHLEEGRWLSGFASAMMDLSDGVYRDVQKLAVASRLLAQIDAAKLPLHECLREATTKGFLSVEEARAFALWGGEDYELLVAVPADQWPGISAEFVKRFNRTLTAVGSLSPMGTAEEDYDFSKNHVHWLNMVKSSPRFATLKFEHF